MRASRNVPRDLSLKSCQDVSPRWARDDLNVGAEGLVVAKQQDCALVPVRNFLHHVWTVVDNPNQGWVHLVQ